MNVELIIQNNKTLYYPSVVDNIEFSTERKDSPGKLSFSVVQDDVLNIDEGNPVILKIDNNNVFYGFIFTRKFDKDNIVDITAYDQLRYLKNKDTIVYTNKTVGELIQLIASANNLNLGIIEDTGLKIASRVEDNTSYFDMIGNALDATIQNKKEMYVLYDDFGKISLRNIKNMAVNLLIDEETGENYSYASSIDTNTYNRVKLIYDNEDTGEREVYIAQDSYNINSWGLLQYFEKIKKGENGRVKADTLLSLYNKKTKTLSFDGLFGDLRVRAGSLIVVKMKVGDTKLSNLMLVEKCKHKFEEGLHTMDLTLRGGDYIV